MIIENCIVDDISEIFSLYDIATEYQRLKETVVVWPEFDKKLIETEIAENRQWKLLIDEKIACVWAITFSDAQIWEERNKDASIYIHRIATNPLFRGRNLVSVIVDWAKKYAKKSN